MEALTLYLIPARGGSKGIPRKNIKLLDGKPLICHSIDFARQFCFDEHICISTDDDTICSVVKSYGLSVPFMRPPHLATDEAGTYEVILHALSHYENMGISYQQVVLLQPTSPFRDPKHLHEGFKIFDSNVDMVVSVHETQSNPYYVLFEEDENGFLQKSKTGNFIRRQDCPPVYEINGSIYIMNVTSLKNTPISQFTHIRKIVMDQFHSVDLDTPLDWEFCEFLLKKNVISLNNPK